MFTPLIGTPVVIFVVEGSKGITYRTELEAVLTEPFQIASDFARGWVASAGNVEGYEVRQLGPVGEFGAHFALQIG